MEFQMPKLDLPGAGLPWLETLFLKYVYFPHKLRQSSWEKCLDKFQRETKNILNICEKLTENEFQTRILIQRLPGMEDSSRFWSAALTIEHLTITMPGMVHVVCELAQGKQFSVTVGAADVKPKQENLRTKVEMLEILRKQSEEAVAKLRSFQEKHSNENRSKHPWFGPIHSEGWVWVLAQHQSLHRRQIQKIVEKL